MQLLPPDQTTAAAKSLTGAFWNDPLLEIVVAPDEKKRAAIGQWFFEKLINYGQRWGEVYTNDEAAAVAVWFPPGQTELTPGRMLRVGLGMLPFKIGLGGVSRFMKAMSVGEKFHKSVHGPHWYLLALGTKPELQGAGLGGALIEVGAAKADAAGVPCYLETATESNVAFYTKRGFEVIEKEDVLGFTLWGMVRKPVQ
jgi:ribosomal protein S18 acetylase RimI-like enzyme